MHSVKNNMKTIVISIGGSVLFSDEINDSYLDKLKIFLEKISKNYKIYLIIGGGKTARKYITIGRRLNFTEELLDELGIDITRINAKIITNFLKNSNKIIPTNTDQAIKQNYKIVVMGGTTPGHSTDMVGAELAKKADAEKYIIATNVDGIYDKDPNKYEDAKQIRTISIKQLVQKYGTDWKKAGKNIVIDGPALEIIQKAKLTTYVVNGKKIRELEKIIENKIFNGTEIKI